MSYQKMESNIISKYKICGSSIARDIGNTLKLKKTEVHPGGKIIRGPKNISSKVEQVIANEEYAIVAIGGNDVTNNYTKNTCSENIQADYVKKIQALINLRKRLYQDKPGHLIIVLLTPRYLTYRPSVTNELLEINATIKRMISSARGNDKKWIHWTDTRKLIDYKMLRRDEVHLTDLGNHVLAKLIIETAKRNL